MPSVLTAISPCEADRSTDRILSDRSEYDEEDGEYYEEKCRHHNMTFVRYLENDEDAWGNTMLGEITVKCPDWGLLISYKPIFPSVAITGSFRELPRFGKSNI